jgi:diguanylate cyclase (GGDEF)-like protein/PAS domain S-box-containing protein
MTLVWQLVQNSTILLTLVVVYSLFFTGSARRQPVTRLLNGVLFGSAAVISMAVPVTLAPGLIFDGRTVVLSLAGFVGGALPAAIATALAALYRGWLGGQGVFVGIATIVTAGAMGVAFRHLINRKHIQVNAGALFVFGLLVHLAVLLWMLALPETLRWQVLSRISLPFLTVFPVLTVLLGLLFQAQATRAQTARALADSEQRFRGTFDQAAVGIAHVAPDGRWLRVNERLCEIVGYPREALLERTFQDISHPDDLASDLSQVQAMLAGEIDTYQMEKRYLRQDGDVVWTNLTVSLLRRPDGTPDHFISVIEDITARKVAERALAENRAFLHRLIDTIPDLIFYKDTQGVYLGCNTAFEAFAGRDATDIVGHSDQALFDQATADAFRAQDQLALMTPNGHRNEEWITYPDGRQVLIETLKTPFFDPESQLLGLIGISRDITERKRAEEALRRNESALHKAQAIAQIGSWQMTIQSQSLTWSRETYRIFGVPEDTPVTFDRFLQRVHPEDREKVARAWHAALEGEDYDIEHRILVDGEERWVRERAELQLDDAGRVLLVLGTVQEITDHRRAQMRIQHLALFDSLTGLPNRENLQDRLTSTIAYMERHGRSPIALMLLDLDHFKNVNDSLGHSIGDLLLQALSQRLQEMVRAEDLVARMGGDEFMLVLPDTPANGAQRVAEKLVRVLAQPYIIDQYHLSVTPSIGIAMYPDNGSDFETLARCADTAMYRAKEARGGAISFYTEAMHRHAQWRLDVENALRSALDRHEFHLHFQPQLAADSGRIIGAEALLRWRHPDWGEVSPARFIPIAEDSGLILPLGSWIVEQVIMQIQAWRKQGLPVVPVAVNLSVVQLRENNLCNDIVDILRRHDAEPRLLELEITESVAMQQAEQAVALIDCLHREGIGLSIDDFGTGYSSLGYLKRFKVHKLKIDASFVRDVSVDQDDATITATIIQMGHSLGLKTLAEGVETPAQLDFLRRHGCDYVQGFYFSRPLAPEAFSALLEQQRIVRAGVGE